MTLFCTRQQQLCLWNFKIKYSRPLFTIILKVRTFWEAHIIWKYLPHGFDVYLRAVFVKILKRLSLSLTADLCIHSKLTEAIKSKKNDSKFSTKTKTKTFQNLNMPPSKFDKTRDPAQEGRIIEFIKQKWSSGLQRKKQLPTAIVGSIVHCADMESSNIKTAGNIKYFYACTYEVVFSNLSTHCMFCNSASRQKLFFFANFPHFSLIFPGRINQK